MFKLHKESFKDNWLLLSAIIFFILLFVFIVSAILFEQKYKGKIYPGIYIGNLNIGGKTSEEATQFINEKLNQIIDKGIPVYYSDKQTFVPLILSEEADSAYPLIEINPENAILEASSFARSGNFFGDSYLKIKNLFTSHRLSLITNLDKDRIEQFMRDEFSEFEISSQNAALEIDEGKIVGIKQERIGKALDYKDGINKLEENLKYLDNKPIKLTSKTSYPEISQEECEGVIPMANEVLLSSPYILSYNENKKWEIKKEQLAQWLILEKNDRKDLSFGLNKDLIYKYFEDKIMPQINIAPVEARFEMKNGRVEEFGSSKDGLEVDFEESFNNFSIAFKDKKSDIKIATKEIKSTLDAEENNFGIKEIIGIGESSFKGSPANRRHNIRVGADALNGILIKPGEEFSLLKTLGKIDGSTGYLPELVIKENKTIPEFGGGLCQIGTTVFRAALTSGLPITQRRNHSYRVSYYEPAGTDATIYDPAPDFRFLNDTKNYILIQKRIEGDNLYFDFWGTKDGRSIEKSQPKIYNIVKPAPTKIIETLDLPVGKKKCTEKAHNGADAYFDYKVTYSDGEVKEKRFSSHYVPWREVCLLGVEKLSTDSGSASTTPATLSSPGTTTPVINQ